MNKRRRSLLIGLAAFTIVGALSLLPVVTVHGQTSPHQAPSGTCPTIQSLTAVASFQLGVFNATLRDQGLTVSISIGSLSSNSTDASLKSLLLTATNSTTGSQVLFFSTELDSVSTRTSGNVTDLSVSLGPTSFRMDPALARHYGIPVTSLSLSSLHVDLVLDCGSGTYTAAYSAQTSVASLVGSYLGRSL